MFKKQDSLCLSRGKKREAILTCCITYIIHQAAYSQAKAFIIEFIASIYDLPLTILILICTIEIISDSPVKLYFMLIQFNSIQGEVTSKCMKYDGIYDEHGHLQWIDR